MLAIYVSFLTIVVILPCALKAPADYVITYLGLTELMFAHCFCWLSLAQINAQEHLRAVHYATMYDVVCIFRTSDLELRWIKYWSSGRF